MIAKLPSLLALLLPLAAPAADDAWRQLFAAAGADIGALLPLRAQTGPAATSAHRARVFYDPAIPYLDVGVVRFAGGVVDDATIVALLTRLGATSLGPSDAIPELYRFQFPSRAQLKATLDVIAADPWVVYVMPVIDFMAIPRLPVTGRGKITHAATVPGRITLSINVNSPAQLAAFESAVERAGAVVETATGRSWILLSLRFDPASVSGPSVIAALNDSPLLASPPVLEEVIEFDPRY